jgi:phosphoribosylaminoimidazole-succinocarboxamide synthase
MLRARGEGVMDKDFIRKIKNMGKARRRRFAERKVREVLDEVTKKKVQEYGEELLRKWGVRVQ